jgi:hypothetical protein
VWATDITYIPMAKGFMYLTAIIDLHTRFVFERKQILLKADKIYFAKNYKSMVCLKF